MTAVEFEIWVAFFTNTGHRAGPTTDMDWQAVPKKLQRKILDVAWGHTW